MAASQENTGFLMHGDEPEMLEGGYGYGCGCGYGCSCFRSFWCGGQRHASNGDDDQSSLLSERRENRELWVVKQLKKLKEVSELIAGPKWKNLIRRIGAYFNNKIKRRKDFRYDSDDYALNFDNGILDENDEYEAGLGFSSRFAPPVTDKSKSSYT